MGRVGIPGNLLPMGFRGGGNGKSPHPSFTNDIRQSKTVLPPARGQGKKRIDDLGPRVQPGDDTTSPRLRSAGTFATGFVVQAHSPQAS